MSSDTHNHDGSSYGQQLLNQQHYDPNQEFLFSGDYSSPGMQEDPPQHPSDVYPYHRSPSPNDFYPSSPHHNNGYDFQLFGNHEPPQQSINPALFEQANPESHNISIDPATLMQQPTEIHHSHSAPGLASGSLITTGVDYDWDGVLGNPSFQTHRAASVRSDISSAAASPLFNHMDQFPGDHNSPLLGTMGEFLHNDQGLGLETFTLSESTHHSPAHSPRLTPIQGAGSGHNSPFLPPQDMLYTGPRPDGGLMGPPALPSESMVDSLANHVAAAVANHDAMQHFARPQIQIEFAPPQRQPTFPGKPGYPADQDALLPPQKPRRPRSLSDPHQRQMTRPVSRSPSRGHERRASLSPSDAGSIASTVSNGSSTGKMARRVSAPPVPELERDKMLALAKGPNYVGGPGEPAKRVQKHPAIFGCTLCPKKFTRATNLRSHCRTHTDERPFVCSICAKAFARQHDRKRHEGLHSGEKRFVCRGVLKHGGAWGCGRKFARADALGRHFRSEAGRICIRPLLEEESAERARAAAEEAAAQGAMDQGMHMSPPGLPPGHPHNHNPMMPPLPTGGQLVGGPGSMVLPTALLQQYPALATIDWDAGRPAGGGGLSGAEGSGRSSYDASGGEYDDDEEDYGIGVGGVGDTGGYDGVKIEWVGDSGGQVW